MGRDADAGQITESQKADYIPFLLLKLELDSGDALVCSLDRNIVFDDARGSGDQIYLGVGNFGKVSPVKEDSKSGATGINVELTGIPTTYISIATNEDYSGRTATLRYGFLDKDYQITAATGDPAILFKGIIDQMFISLGKTASVKLTIEDDWIRWEEQLRSLYTNEEQQSLFPGDLGLEFVNQTVDKELIWGRS